MCILLFMSAVVSAPPVRAEELSRDAAITAGYDVYAAWYLRNQRDYRSIIEYGGITDELFDNVNSLIWQSELLAWKTANFSLKNALNANDKEIGYYETKLLNILYSTMSEDCTPVWLKAYHGIFENADDIAEAQSAGTVKNILDLAETPIEQSVIYNLDIYTDTDTVNQYIKILGDLPDYKLAMEKVSDVTKYFSYCKTFSDLLIRLEKINMLVRQQTEMKWLLNDMKGMTDYRNNPSMTVALDDFAAAFSGELTENQIDAIFTANTAFSVLEQELSDLLWKKFLLTLGKYGVAIKVGQGFGKMEADILFNTSEVIVQFYQLEAMMNLEKVFRQEVYDREAAFQADPTPENARKFLYAFCMMLNAYQEGADTVAAYLDASWNEGAFNDVRGFIERLQKPLRDLVGDKSGYETYDEDRAFVLRLKDNLGNYMSDYERIVYNSYTEELLLRPELGYEMLDFTRVEGDIINSENAPAELRTMQFDGENAIVSWDVTFQGQYIFPGDLTLESGHLDLNCFRTVVQGDLYINKGRLDLNGNVLTVYGNIYHRGGEVRLGEGSIICAGDYLMTGADSDLTPGRERYTTSMGTLYMTHGWDTVTVRGRMIWNSMINHDEPVLSAGTLNVSGDLQNFGNGRLSPAAEHLTVFNGHQKQTVFHNEYSEFGSVRFDNPDLEFRKYVKWKRLIGALPENLNDAALYDDSLPGAQAESEKMDKGKDPAGIQPGQLVEFGEFAPYDGMEGTERKPLHWLVLDQKEDMALLLSEKVLFAMVMDNGREWDETPARWDDCTMRTWHLVDFCDQAFNLEERSAIVKTTIKNDREDTEDGVFLLSLEEVERYLPSEEERIAHATTSAMIRGWLDVRDGDCAYWWTRTDDGDGHFVYVRPDGRIDENGEASTYSFYGVRPAMWVRDSGLTIVTGEETEQPTEFVSASGDQRAADQASAGEKTPEERLLDIYEGDGDLLIFCPADYDGDGQEEAFALLGRYDDENFDNMAELWFVSGDSVIQCERAGGCYPFDCFLTEQDGQLCFQVSEGYFGSGGALRWWAVKENRPYLLGGEYMLEDLNVAD